MEILGEQGDLDTCRLYPIRGRNDSMKQKTRLFFLFFIMTAFFVSPCLGVAAGIKKKGPDMASWLRGKTFFIVEHARDKKPKKDYHAYFKKDGILAIKFSAKHSKSGKWAMDNKGVLCITTNRHKKRTTVQETKCGKLVKKNDSAYHWYDAKARQRATFSLKGKGNRLP
jgi:hypothetical protein